ncbi:GntR family transcriptional regulator [Streptomyces prunicolor]|uniref:GntR family transcriptional regulator n=1 Tax=Streptomyces prunicolor TaxID=67348 RepID=UPI00225B93DB|nr:GntR family transcriptional regulator [Streptomyces prunicolor]MCX5235968.1 GntR family transcriptional regulator [Streptomyces prunicolor]
MSTLNGAAAAAGRPVLVTDVLRERIVEGELPPGTPLRDVALSAELGVSRNTLREALRTLHDEGLVVQQLHKGTAVKTLAAEDVTDIYLARRTLELSAVDASPLAPEPLLDAIEAKVAAAELAVDAEAWDKVGTASLRFHQSLVALLGSARLDGFFRVTIAQLRLAFAVMADQGAFQAPWVARDREICDLIRGGRRMDATAALRLYLDESERMVLDAVRASSRTTPTTRTRTARTPSTTRTTPTTTAAKGKR